MTRIGISQHVFRHRNRHADGGDCAYRYNFDAGRRFGQDASGSGQSSDLLKDIQKNYALVHAVAGVFVPLYTSIYFSLSVIARNKGHPSIQVYGRVFLCGRN